jgi:TetR/AcrR family transcriptional regulator
MTATHQLFQRARKPEEIEARRETLLAAAAELFDAEGPMGAGLNAIAARAGFTKSNVYRYFESREQVLLELFLAEAERLIPALGAQIAAVPEGDVTALAAALANCFGANVRFGHLSAILVSVLEANVSEDTLIAVKRKMVSQAHLVGTALMDKLPGTRLADCLWAFTMVGTLASGMWPGARPSPTAARVLAREEFAAMKPDIGRDLERAAAALLNAIVPPPALRRR